MVARESTSTDGQGTATTVVVCGGHDPHPAVRNHLDVGAVVVAADSGWHGARSLGLLPAVLIGDLDSIGDGGLAEAREFGVEVVRHPVDKDSTDTELAIAHVLGAGATEVTVLLGGDRIDHVLGAMQVLGDPSTATTKFIAFVGPDRITRVTPFSPASIPCVVGTTISLLPLGGDARGVIATGLRWSLAREDLHAHSSRGLSNVAENDVVEVTVESGTVLVVEPGYLTNVPAQHAPARQSAQPHSEQGLR